MTAQIPYEIECPIYGSMLKQHKDPKGYVWICYPHESEKARQKHPHHQIAVLGIIYPLKKHKVLRARD